LSKYNSIITKKFLYNEYIINKFSIPVIANMIKCSWRTIARYLQKYNIKTRTISETRLGRFTGKDNPHYKDGKRCENYHNYCKCGNEIDYRDRKSVV
jgi:hypothetical protein